MPDMKEAMQKAGFSSSSPKKGSSGMTRGGFQLPVPDDYPAYFDEKGVIKSEYLTDLAERIAQQFEKDKLTPHQLRAFYGHVKRQKAALAVRSWEYIYPEIQKLKPFAHDRHRRNSIPASFEEFIRRNVDKVQDQTTFVDGFVEHFQAVVAYCTGRLKQR